MKADYKNWVPNSMIYGFGAAAAGLAALAGGVRNRSISALLGAGALGCGSGVLTIAGIQIHKNDKGWICVTAQK